jgi:photosynthetic reaction center cytochrome c subunit
MKRLPAFVCVTTFSAISVAVLASAQNPQPPASQNSTARQAPAPPSPPAGPGQKTAEQQFKNIQIFKGYPADQLIPSMQFITASLGVECDFCHNREAMDSDEKKPKKIARQMMTMMFEINADNFDSRQQVTCNTCHRGAAKPVSIPVIKDDEMPTPPGPVANKPPEAPLPKAEDLLDKYLAAVGGASALDKITTRVQKGKLLAFGGQTFPADVYSKGPDKRISIMHLQGGDSVTAFDGQRGWLTVPGRPAHMMSNSENAAAHMDADLQFPEHVKSLYAKFTVENGEKIDGHETYLVQGQADDRPPLRLYLDKQTGLLDRLIRYAQSPLGLNPTQIDYADYRDADGIKVPFRWTVARPNNRFTIQVEQFQQNVAVDDAKFAAPPPPPAPPPAAAHP